jgi:L,D-transpeptidase ErfK/SrfK
VKRHAARRACAWLGLGAIFACLAGPARAAVFALTPGQQAVGAVESILAGSGDTLLDIARRFDLGYTELIVTNPGVDPWQPGAGRRIVLPLRFLLPAGPRRGIVVPLAERRLFYFPPGGDTVETFPIGVDVDGLDTPGGETRIVAKIVDPAWYPPPSIRAERPGLPRVIAAGPDNPLGAYALRLGWPDYLIHGTNKPDGVGRNVSHGCLHLYPEDIARLFHEVAVGTTVRVEKEETLLQWVDGALLLEIHPDKGQADALDTGLPMTPRPPADLAARVVAAAGDELGRVDWAAVRQAGRTRDGIPVAIAGMVETKQGTREVDVEARLGPP